MFQPTESAPDSRRRAGLPRGASPTVPRPGGPEPLRRKRVEPAPAGPRRRRIVHILLVFVTVVLLVDALVGDKGFMDTMRARREHVDAAARLDALKRENQRLREDVRRLRDDPGTIESIAREELGLIRPGEMLFIIKDK
jgi:cell division protein FtsB